MEAIHDRSYIAIRISQLCEEIKDHTALTEYDEKIIRACIHEIFELLDLNVSCYSWFVNNGGNANAK